MIDFNNSGIEKTVTMCRIIVIGIILSTCLAAQTRSIKERIDDAFDEVEHNLLTLYVNNATDGNAVSHGTLVFPNGSAYDIMDGKVKFPVLNDGIYPVQFIAEGFVPTKYDLEIMAGSLFLDRISLSPGMELGEIRIVLDWASDPSDLDAHFTKEGNYHISFQNMHVADDRKVTLDIDSRNGYGPETITVKQISSTTEYQYWVHDYSNRHQQSSEWLSKSHAKVKIYDRDMLVHTITVPQKRKGETWRVFSIIGGKIKIHNIIQ